MTLTSKTTSWAPNPTQQKFLKALTAEPQTLAEINKATGNEFKTGSINALVKKGLVEHGEDRTLVCPCCGRKTTVKTYKLASASTKKDEQSFQGQV